MKKVLFIVPGLVFGGAEKQAVSLINNLDAKKVTLSLASLSDKKDIAGQIMPGRLRDSIFYHRAIKFDATIAWRLYRYIGTNSIDVIFAVGQYAMLYGFVVQKIFGSPVRMVVALHETLPRPGTWELCKNILYDFLLRNIGDIVFVSEIQRDYWRKRLRLERKSSLKCILNGVDTARFSSFNQSFKPDEVRRDIGIQAGAVVLGAVAALRPEKRHEDLLSAGALLREGGYPAEILIVGDGPRRDAVMNHARNLGIADFVHITGFKDDVRPFLAAMDCVIFSSHYIETLSIAAIEAMAMEKALIMTDIGGASEIVNHGFNGYLYAPGDIGTMAMCVRSMVDEDLFQTMGRRARQIAGEKFSLEAMIGKYEALLLE